MANEQELIETLRRQTKAIEKLAKSVGDQAAAINLQATALHALADSLAACTTEDAPEPEPEKVPVGPTYADGTPIG